MICRTCGIAGEMIGVAREWNVPTNVIMYVGPDPTVIRIKDNLRAVASLYHGKCKGSTHCDCQHKIDFEGKTVQKESNNGREATRELAVEDSSTS